MPWWGWIALGGGLILTELLVGGQLYLLFAAIAALAVGVVVAIFGGTPLWLQWTIFGITAPVLVLGLRRHAYAKFNRFGGYQNIAGEYAIVDAEIAPGEHGLAELHGAQWAARNIGATPLAAGQRVRVAGVDKLTLNLAEEAGDY